MAGRGFRSSPKKGVGTPKSAAAPGSGKASKAGKGRATGRPAAPGSSGRGGRTSSGSGGPGSGRPGTGGAVGGRGSLTRAGGGAVRSGSSGSSGGTARSGGSRGFAARGGSPRTTPTGAPKERGLGGEQVEGRQAVRELLMAGKRRVREVWIAADVDPAPILDDIRELAADQRVPVEAVARKRLETEARTDAPQGVLAKASPLRETPLEDLARPSRHAPPFLLALDGVTDPGNLGAILRSAECAGVSGVVLPRHRAAHVTPTVAKTAAGAVEHLPMAVVSGLPAAILQLKELGVWVVGLDGDADQDLFDLPELGSEPVCLVLGAEGEGLSRLVRQRCDAVVAIPLHGQLGSLNVSAAAALACYEVARRRRLA